MYKSVLFNPYHDPLHSFKVRSNNELHTETGERDQIHNSIDFDGYLHSRTAFIIYFSSEVTKKIEVLWIVAIIDKLLSRDFAEFTRRSKWRHNCSHWVGLSMAYTLIRELLEPVWIINEVYTISYSSWGENVFQLVQKKKRRGLNKQRRFASGFVHACCC